LIGRERAEPHRAGEASNAVWRMWVNEMEPRAVRASILCCHAATPGPVRRPPAHSPSVRAYLQVLLQYHNLPPTTAGRASFTASTLCSPYVTCIPSHCGCRHRRRRSAHATLLHGIDRQIPSAALCSAAAPTDLAHPTESTRVATWSTRARQPDSPLLLASWRVR
jgi:hypothetical protein